ncbi:WG repeat-containing protein [Aureibaculum sp. 2210JD6-5]|uniref:WG repeat-containing protein n=1 Tax=Aureibaculum sp. 2210JD6-5 TaxID=3103957 RepID=UPI002AAC821D|nr:WG repeat-containing protein [Aureibaculum sp. 2210JD6-5]MDY7395712.1 WG repeat-containing protein [Aureibaculum sp. 2210JD6-5]
MKKSNLFALLFLFGQVLLAQNLRLTIEELIYLGKVPQNNLSNIEVDKLDYDLSYDIPNDSTIKIGYLNAKGKTIIDPIYDMGLDYYGEYANVIKDSVYGVIDKKGNTKFYKQYDKVLFYKGNVGMAVKNNLSGLINKEGKPISDFIYSRIDIFGIDCFKATIGTGEKKQSFVLNKKGEVMFKLNAKNRSIIMADSLLIYEDVVNEKKKQGLININGNVSLKAQYDELMFEYGKDDYVFVVNNGKKGYINKKGEVIVPIIYDELGLGFNEGLLAASKNGKWGFIDKNNQVVIPFIYDDANGFYEELAFVKKGDYYGYIDKNNKIKIPFRFHNSKFAFFAQSRCVFADKETGKYGFINKKGKVIVKPIYDMALPFYNDKALVRLNGKEGYIDRKGKEVVPIKYRQLWLERNGMIRFVK